MSQLTYHKKLSDDALAIDIVFNIEACLYLSLCFFPS